MRLIHPTGCHTIDLSNNGLARRQMEQTLARFMEGGNLGGMLLCIIILTRNQNIGPSGGFVALAALIAGKPGVKEVHVGFR